jgi:hypothetical protein
MQEKQEKKAKLLALVFSVLWVAMMAAIGVSLAFNGKTDSTFSQEENRMLQGLPKLSFESMLHGDFSGQFENYLLDNFLLRDSFTRWSKDIQNMLSLASLEDTVLAIDDQKDALSLDITTLPPIETWQPQPSGSLQPEQTAAVTKKPSVSASPDATSPPVTPKPTYPSTVSLIYSSGASNITLLSYKAKNVEFAADIINSYAACLKPGGRLCYIMVPSSYVANKYILNKSAKNLASNIEECLRANVLPNVEIFSVAEILSEPIKRGEYVYFRSDRHWTPLGCHYAYEAMMRRLGMVPVPYSSYAITQEYPFLGTLYRDNPTASMRRNPDTMDIVQPYGEAAYYEMNSPGKLTESPLLDMKAPSNDRHAIYLGNSRAAWSVIKTTANTGRKALVVRDSFGLIFTPYLVPHYDEIHIVNPMYFNKKIAGGSVKDLMDKYGIDDCYILIGDIHAYNNEFLMTTMPKILIK